MTKIHSILVALLTLGVCMFVASSPAFAKKVYVPGVSFGSPGSGDDQFEEPAGVAVNDSTNTLTEPAASDVYVVDKGNNRVERFNATGEYQGQFNGSETPAGGFSSPESIAVDNDEGSSSFGDIYVADVGHNVIDRFNSTGTYLSQLTGFGGLQAITFDRSGNLWVYDSGREVYECGAAGSCTAKFNTGLEAGQGLAVDSSENVFVLWASVGVVKFSPETSHEDWNAYFYGEGIGVSAFAINPSTNNLIVAEHPENSESDTIVLYGPSGEPYTSLGSNTVKLTPIESFPSGGLSDSHGIAVNGADGTVYATERGASKVESFDFLPLPTVTPQAPSDVSETGMTLHGTVNPEGLLVEECYFEYGSEAGVYTSDAACEPHPGKGVGQIGEGTAPVPVSAQLSGLPPGAVRSFRLVAKNALGTAKSGGLSTPAISGESFSGVGSIAATVSAQIDPNGLPTTYSVEYGTSLAYGSQTAETSFYDGDAGTTALSVSVQMTGLQPETVYHLRVVASNALGTSPGKDITLTTFPAPAAALPDGRVYELVSSPPQGHDADVYVPGVLEALTENEAHGIWTGSEPFDVSPDGEAVLYAGDAPPTGGSGNIGGSLGDDYLSRRAPEGGWTQTPVVDEATVPGAGSIVGFSSDLSIGVFEGQSIPGTGAPSAYGNWYTHALAGGAAGEYDPFYTTIPDRSAQEVSFVESEADAAYVYAGTNAGTSTVPAASQLLFEMNAGLLEGEGQLEKELGEDVEKEAKEGTEREFGRYLYDSVDGRPYLVDVLPDGRVAPGATFGSLEEQQANGFGKPGFTRVISADGSRVFWTAAPEAHVVKGEVLDRSQGLYVRENPTRPQSPLNGEECTVPTDACTVQVGPSGSIFQTASTDGSKVFFTTSNGELYGYDLETGETIELTPGVEVKGVAATSEDGEYVYYVASNGNIELWHDGITTLVAAGAGLDGAAPYGDSYAGGGFHNDYVTELGNRTAEATPDGHSLIFSSTASLTGYDNVLGGAPLDEVFLYEAGSGSGGGVLRCVSCNPSGEPPVPSEPSAVSVGDGGGAVGGFFPISGNPYYQTQSITDDGSRVFFDSAEPLVPQATNGWVDAYEWERDGTGSCRTSTGCIYLLSGGTDSENSYLIGASASGDDVFFISRAELVPADRGGDDFVLYDARIGGVQPPAAPACSGTGCQGVPPPPPTFATPSSVTFNGVGNFVSPAPAVSSKKTTKKIVKCKKDEVRKGTKCIKKPKRGKKAKRARRASNDRRAGR